MTENNITHIYHIGDIHLRNLKRHKEYRSVFKKFFDNVKKDGIKDSVIYIAGDLVHAKTEMSPELIREVSWFLTECAKLRHTFVIAGNHDCMRNNTSRLDAITPIVENLGNDRIHYLRNTGVYNFRNLTFAVYSIFDNMDNWPKGYDILGDNKICFFHGPINTAATDVGYAVTSKSFTAEMFDGFDMVMLGDIHMKQVIQDYDGKANKPIIVYSGSFIQQNHGESLNGHGYLLWDIQSRTFEAINIPNDYGYYTLDVNDGVVPDVSDMPKYPRLRVRISNTQPSQIKKVLTTVKKKYKVQEFTVTRMDTLSRQKQGNTSDGLFTGDVRDVEFQNELLTDYLNRQFLLDDETIDKIKDINRGFNTSLKDDDIAANITWIPKTFEFSNMFSYGENNIIRFDNLKGIVGLFAANAMGKSAALDALAFCIFDKSSRAFLARKILNNRKNSFNCKLHFQIDDIDYYIERTAKVVSKGTHVKVDVNFWKEEGGEIISLNGEQRRETNAIIQQYLGTFDDFILTSMSLQNNNALFIDKSQTERKEILAQFLGVNVFDKLYQIAYEENRSNSTLIRKFKQDDFTGQLAGIENELTSKRSEFELVQEKIKQTQLKLDGYNKELLSLNGKIVKIKSDNYTKEELDIKRNEVEENIKNVTQNTDNAQEKLVLLEERHIEVDKLLDGFDDDLLENYNQFIQYKLNINEAQSDLTILNATRTPLVDRLNHLKSHEYNPSCEICMKNSKSIIETIDSVGLEIQKMDESIQTIEEKIDKNTKLANEYAIYGTLYLEHGSLVREESEISSEIDKILSRLSTLETTELQLRTSLKETEQLIANYIENERQIKENTELRRQIKEIEKAVNLHKENLRKDNIELLRLNGLVSSLQSQKDIIEKRIKEVELLEEQQSLYEYYLNALNKDGISYELISKALPAIEGEANNILGQIVDFGVQLNMDGKDISANLVYDDQIWSLELCSGMERFISGLAIRIALINVCNLPRPNFLVIDEGFGVMDNDNLTSLYMLFSYLKTQFDFVLVISHIDSMRDVVDLLIEIKKVNGFSNIRF